MTEIERLTNKDFMSDFWKFFRKYADPKDDEDFWDDVLMGADELMKRYSHDPVLDQIVAGFVDGLDEKWRKATGRWTE